MDQISQQIIFTNNKIQSYDRMFKIIVNLGIKKGDNNDNYYSKISCKFNSLLMCIVDTPEKNLSHG